MKKNAKHSAKRKATPVARSPGPPPARETAEPAWFGGAAQSVALLRTVLDSLTYPLYVIDVANYHVRLANRTAQETCSRDAITCYALTHRRDTPCNTEDHPCPTEVIQRTGQSTVVEHVHYDRDGTPKNVEVHAFPIFDEAGRVIQIIEYCVDITARKRAEEALHDLNVTLETKVAQRTEELERRAWQLQKLTLELSQAEDRERRRLAEILHDDLQQTLAAAKFHLNILGSRIKETPAPQAIIAQIDRMLRDAIATSRSLSHELSPAGLQRGDFVETLRWLAEQVQAKHGLTVHVDGPGETRVSSDALRTFLYRATQELLFNTSKHAQVREARVRVRRLRDYVGLSVSDRGRGFDLQDLKATTGFGLLSIRERVELLGGRMKIKSARGKGSTFQITVPDDPAAVPEIGL